MKFQEFKEKILTGENIKYWIKLKPVSLLIKNSIAKDIVNICLETDINGLVKVDFMLKELFVFLYSIANYIDLDISDVYKEDGSIDIEKAIEIYDFFVEKQLIDLIYEYSKDLIVIVEEMIIQEKEINNSVSGVISGFLTKVLDKIPSEEGIKSIMSELPNIINNANPDNLKFISEAIGFNNGKIPNRQQRRKADKEKIN